MSQDEELTKTRLTELWNNPDIPILDTKGNKYVIFSDIHLGNGGGADDFHANEKALLAALDFYREREYKLILLGDIEEFWQFDLDQITNRYDHSVYATIRSFNHGNLYRVYGNHDIDWCQLDDPATDTPIREKCAIEALKMIDLAGNTNILLVHGHQGSTESDKDSWASRFWVRLYRKVEPLAKKLGFTRHPSATKSRVPTDYERILYSWAKENGVMLICGHSHRAIFSSRSYAERLKDKISELQKEILESRGNNELIDRNRKEIKKLHEEYLDEKKKKRLIDPAESNGKPKPCYFNTGCGLYSDGITGIEIADDTIKLAKWHRSAPPGSQYEIYEEGNLSAYISDVIGH
ncbi:MAG: metallophosphoesterase family protein [Candidatus Aminicenantes bacterium]|jgi:UDP-2,3-diacylglucosamine pyrophosphatase LpxH